MQKKYFSPDGQMFKDHSATIINYPVSLFEKYLLTQDGKFKSSIMDNSCCYHTIKNKNMEESAQKF